jgi:uncharacterized protein YndB with AHSA1/START domain
MKKYAWMLLGLFILTVGVLGIISPKKFIVERSIIVNKGRFEVFDKIRSLKTHKEWNPWAKKDPSIVYDFKGVDGTEGFISHWVGNNQVGEGEQEIKQIVEGERIDYEIRFKSPFETTSYSTLTTTEEGDSKTKLTWSMRGQMNFPFNVIFKILKMQEKLEYDFEEGTNVLKAILEKDV